MKEKDEEIRKDLEGKRRKNKEFTREKKRSKEIGIREGGRKQRKGGEGGSDRNRERRRRKR